MRMRWSTLPETLEEVEAVGDKRGYAHGLLNTLADTLAEEEALGDKRGDAHALFNTLADTTFRR